MAGNDESTRNSSDSESHIGQESAVEQSMSRVLLVNDNVTTMEFVVRVLMEVFQKSREQAVRITRYAHHMGTSTCGAYLRDEAERLREQVADLAREHGFPLRCLVESGGFVNSDPNMTEVPLPRSNGVTTQQGRLGDLPAVILEAGGGGAGECWFFVRERLAWRTLAVSYDRAGLGQNTEWADDVGAGGVASRLQTLLAREAIPPPYLLVGHSLGGLFVQYYAVTHPEEVAGLVLIDPTPAHDLADPALEDLRGWGDRAAAQLAGDQLGGLARELRAAEESQMLVARNPVAPEVPILMVTTGGWPRSTNDAVPPDVRAEALALTIQQHQNQAARSALGKHIIMQNADHQSVVLYPKHAAELAEHILEFAKACCRALPAQQKPRVPVSD
jgi:ATP-dependent Clp protease adapter protein ClpS